MILMRLLEFFQREIHPHDKNNKVEQTKLRNLSKAHHFHDHEIGDEAGGNAQAIALGNALGISEETHKVRVYLW
ncbi:MAG: hypothetical protein HC859_07300 [Bacteroidia bacterium]|nr:hypothetical protein [Bacteroidia bacterium]